MAHFSQLLGQSLFPLGNHVLLACFKEVGIQIHFGTWLVLQALRHGPGYLGVFGNQVRRPAELMPFAVPEEVQKQKVILAVLNASAAAYHLGIQGPDLRNSENGNHIDGGMIVTFCQKHGV